MGVENPTPKSADGTLLEIHQQREKVENQESTDKLESGANIWQMKSDVQKGKL